MLKWITKENIEEIGNDSFLKVEEVKQNLENDPFGKYLILKEDKILGYIYYSEIYERVEINQFEVEQSYRNCGLGNILLKEFTETVEKSITLEVRVDNMNAIHLYEKYGFVKQAIRENYYQGCSGILMERKAL